MNHCDHRWNVGREKHAQYIRDAAEARIANMAVEKRIRKRIGIWQRWAEAVARGIEIFSRRGSF